MTLSSRINRTAVRVRRVHRELSHVNRRMFELTTALPTGVAAHGSRSGSR